MLICSTRRWQRTVDRSDHCPEMSASKYSSGGMRPHDRRMNALMATRTMSPARLIYAFMRADVPDLGIRRGQRLRGWDTGFSYIVDVASGEQVALAAGEASYSSPKSGAMVDPFYYAPDACKVDKGVSSGLSWTVGEHTLTLDGGGTGGPRWRWRCACGAESVRAYHEICAEVLWRLHVAATI